MKKNDLYKHYKGNVYRIIDSAIHTETGEHLVIYKKLQDPAIWARPSYMFGDEVDGKPRFFKIPNNIFDLIDELNSSYIEEGYVASDLAAESAASIVVNYFSNYSIDCMAVYSCAISCGINVVIDNINLRKRVIINIGEDGKIYKMSGISSEPCTTHKYKNIEEMVKWLETE